MHILTRYVLVELAKVFLTALTGLTLMMIVVGLVKEGSAQGLPPAQTLLLIPYVLPDELRFTLPVTMLLACTTVFARMAGANEVVAVKALGISPLVLLKPAFFLAFLLSIVCVWLNDTAQSWGRAGIENVVLNALESIIYNQLRAQHRYSAANFSINVKRVDGRSLLGVTVSMQERGDSPGVTIAAEEAELHLNRAEQKLTISFRNLSIDMTGSKVNGHAELPEYVLPIPINEASRQRAAARLPSTLALWEIPKEIADQRAAIAHFEQDIALRAAYQMLTGDFEQLSHPFWGTYVDGRADLNRRLCRLLTEPHRRWSAGFSCLCFVLVGAPMAIRMRNRDFLTSFFVCFLPILLVYYPLLMFGVAGAKDGTVPAYSVWAGNALLLLWGLWLLQRVMRY
jgi:lipopolysaccharide export system permease protein